MTNNDPFAPATGGGLPSGFPGVIDRAWAAMEDERPYVYFLLTQTGLSPDDFDFKVIGLEGNGNYTARYSPGKGWKPGPNGDTLEPASAKRTNFQQDTQWFSVFSNAIVANPDFRDTLGDPKNLKPWVGTNWTWERVAQPVRPYQKKDQRPGVVDGYDRGERPSEFHYWRSDMKPSSDPQNPVPIGWVVDEVLCPTKYEGSKASAATGASTTDLLDEVNALADKHTAFGEFQAALISEGLMAKITALPEFTAITSPTSDFWEGKDWS